MKDSKPEFKRQESWRYKRISENWRRPRGVTSKMRKEEKGFPAKVKVGYRTDSTARGRHPRGLIDQLVWRESELERLDPKLHIIRVSGRVGERKRLGIIAKAKEQNFHIANPGKEESRPVTEAATVERETVPAQPRPETETMKTAEAATREESPSEDETE